MNKITLIIVDPQYDFIEGGKLPVKGGTKALDNVVAIIIMPIFGKLAICCLWLMLCFCFNSMGLYVKSIPS